MVSFLALANVFVWLVIVHEQPSRELKVYFLDVGQGDAIYVRAPGGNDLLIDGGPDHAVLSRLGGVMPFSDRELNLVVASHPDSDHIGGLPAIAQSYRVDGFVESGVNHDSALSRELKAELGREKIPDILATKGTKIFLDPNTKIEILSPVGDVQNWETNRASLVFKLTYGQTSFLFTGDVPREVEDYLARSGGAELRSDVLKVSHHGSKNSSSLAFTGFVQPEYAVISVGKDNRFGHPHKEVINLLDRLKIKTLRTDELGTIVFTSDGQSVKYVEK